MSTLNTTLRAVPSSMRFVAAFVVALALLLGTYSAKTVHEVADIGPMAIEADYMPAQMPKDWYIL